MAAPAGTLLLTSAVGFLAAFACLYAGRTFWRTRPPEARGVGAKGFATYWHASAAYHVLTSSMWMLGALGVTPFAAFLVLRHLLLVVAAVCLASLAFSLLYLFTGSRRWLWPTILFYAAVCVTAMAVVQASAPTGVVVGDWKVELSYEQPLSGAAKGIAVLLLLPQILGSLAYGTLYWHLKDPQQRWRVAILAPAIFGWYLGTLAAELARSPFWSFVTRPGIGIVVAALVVLAYAPPAWVRARWSPSFDAGSAKRQAEARKEASRQALQERARLLL
jgi:hypothetical protein